MDLVSASAFEFVVSYSFLASLSSFSFLYRVVPEQSAAIVCPHDEFLRRDNLFTHFT